MAFEKLLILVAPISVKSAWKNASTRQRFVQVDLKEMEIDYYLSFYSLKHKSFSVMLTLFILESFSSKCERF